LIFRLNFCIILSFSLEIMSWAESRIRLRNLMDPTFFSFPSIIYKFTRKSLNIKEGMTYAVCNGTSHTL